MTTEAAGLDRNVVFNRCVVDGLVLGTVVGAASGTAAAPVLGTIIGAFVGLLLAIPVALVVAAVIARAAREPGTVTAYRRRIDVTFVVLAAATALLAIGWISLDPLVGSAPALTMLLVLVLGLLLVRARLRRLAAPAPG
jgi:hypothetical protein